MVGIRGAIYSHSKRENQNQNLFRNLIKKGLEGYQRQDLKYIYICTDEALRDKNFFVLLID